MSALFVNGHVPGKTLESMLSTHQLQLSQVDVYSFPCDATCLRAKYATALVACQTISNQALALVAQAINQGASIHVQSSMQPEELKAALLLSGFVDVNISSGVATARKPSWETGAKASLSLKRPAPAQSTTPSAWKLSADDNEDELLDEEELLTEEDKKAGPTAPAGGDCSTSRKACANCSCGRAEAEAAGQKQELTQDMLDNPQTNCGNCALGDAFRCAGCPYRGLPSFEPGKKITLPTDFLTADA